MIIFRWIERYPSALFVLMAATVWGLVVGGMLIEWKDPFIKPCPMCVFQRYLYILIGVVALIAALHIRFSKKTVPVYSVINLLIAAVGVYTAAKQSWMQWNPVAGGTCTSGGDDFYSAIEGLPLRDWLPAIFKGTGDCYSVDWTFLGLSIANWSFVAFSCCVIAMVLMFFKGGKAKYSMDDR